LPDKDRFRDDLEKRDRKHESGTESQQILKASLISSVKTAGKEDQSAKDICQCREQAKDKEM
jgi:hypothetical protein